MSANRERDQAGEMAERHETKALDKARGISDPWYRAQALSLVARYINGDPIKIANEAARAAALCEDTYKQVAVRAWEIAALAERDKKVEARKALSSAISQSKFVTPNSSRAEALTLLLCASTRIGAKEIRLVSDEILGACGGNSHWRCVRAIVDAAAILAKLDQVAAATFVSKIRDEKTKRKAEKEIFAGGRDSRPFF